MEKRCIVCGIVFKTKSHKAKYCNDCGHEIRNESRYISKIIHQIPNRIVIEMIKDEIGCMHGCKDVPNVCLEFHHIGEKSNNIGTLVASKSTRHVLTEIQKCIILCSNCHQELHYGNNMEWWKYDM